MTRVPTPSEGPSALSTMQREALLTFLGIPTDLPNRGPPSLHTAYAKYKAVIASIPKMKDLKTSQEWADHLEDVGAAPGWGPIYVDLVNMFIAKSQFYSSWKSTFDRIKGYLEMKAWLDNASDYESDDGLWDEKKNPDDYTFVDLQAWAKKRAVVKKGVVKGKKPAVTSSNAGKKGVSGSKEKRKKPKKASTEEEEEEEEEEEKEESSEGEVVKCKQKSKGKKKASE